MQEKVTVYMQGTACNGELHDIRAEVDGHYTYSERKLFKIRTYLTPEFKKTIKASTPMLDNQAYGMTFTLTRELWDSL